MISDIILDMGLSICSFASGSTGNCIFVSTGTTKILIDAGVSVKKIEESLAKVGESTENLSVLVTHAHTDHIKDLPQLAKKYNLPVYAHRKTVPALRAKMDGGKLIPFSGEDFFVGEITVSPFLVSHDVHCIGYSLYHRGKKITVATDLGRVDDCFTDYVKDSDMVFLEANHDEELVRNNPNYSPWLKQRILSDKGHLSNSACASAALALCGGKTKNIILGHLSRENNYPELAYSEVCSYLARNGIVEGRDVVIDVAYANEISKRVIVG